VRIHVGDPELVPQLLEYFEEQTDCVVAQVGDAEIEVSLLGSFGIETHDGEVERLIEAFRAEMSATPRPPEPPATNGSGRS
jgi:hypothetical protein